jgi:microcystin-dependent protein
MQGAVIIASLVAGGKLTFTRIVVGDGEMPSGKTPMSMTELSNRLFDVPISAIDWDSESKATVKGAFSNKDLSTGFWYREIGLYCLNPVTGAEELYCYGNAGDEAEYISPAGGSSLIEKEVHLVTLIGNATEVTALFDDKTLALKSEVDAALALKADLDATDAEGGRVVARQMRFEPHQILYVDASAAAVGDGSEDKPFRTIMEAVTARYRGTNNIVIYIKPGTYTENIKVEAASGSSWFFGRWGDSGTVTVSGNMEVRNCNFVECQNIVFTAPDADYVLSINRAAGFLITSCTFNGGTTYAVPVGTSYGIIQNCVINNSANAIYAWGGSQLTTTNITGTGNSNGLVADNSTILDQSSTITAQNRYVRIMGGAINTADGSMSFTSNYSQLKQLGTYTSADTLRAALLSEFAMLQGGEARFCQFFNNISGGFGGIFNSGQMIQCMIAKGGTDDGGYGSLTFYSADIVAMAYMQIRKGAFVQSTPIEFGETPGFIKPFAGNGTPYGRWLLCNGAAVSRTTYADLFSVIGTLYGAGNGSTTFNLPDMTDRFIQGSATAGTVKAAGLPNITGGIQTSSKATSSPWLRMSGWDAFAGETRGSTSIATVDVLENVANTGLYNSVNFDASRSSSIYGNSTTVQPPALTMRHFIRY